MKSIVILSLLFSTFFVFDISAQTLLIKNEIPDDLLITLTKDHYRNRNYFEMSINSNGEFTFPKNPKFLANLPREVYVLGKPIKNPKYLKPKLSSEKLKQLVAEFEKVDFFSLTEDTAFKTGKIPCSTHATTDIISITINGQTKEVSNYLGCSSKRNRLLRNLAERIHGASIWNYENNEIPEVFEIWYRVTDASKIEQDFTINGEGKIVKKFFWEIDAKSGQKLYASYPLKTKTVGKLSKIQIKELMDEFEKAVFSTFRYSLLTKYSGCINEAGLNEHKRAHINVQMNHIAQMYASLYKDCKPKPETDAAKFEYINTVIKKLLKDNKLI